MLTQHLEKRYNVGDVLRGIGVEHDDVVDVGGELLEALEDTVD